MEAADEVSKRWPISGEVLTLTDPITDSPHVAEGLIDMTRAVGSGTARRPPSRKAHKPACRAKPGGPEDRLDIWNADSAGGTTGFGDLEVLAVRDGPLKG